MPKRYRLSGEEIKKLSDRSLSPSGKRYHGKFFSLSVTPLTGAHPKFAVVVSKKVSLRAVDRNKVKRRARSSAARYISNISKSVSLVLYAKPEVLRAAFSDVLNDIATLFSKV